MVRCVADDGASPCSNSKTLVEMDMRRNQAHYSAERKRARAVDASTALSCLLEAPVCPGAVRVAAGPQFTAQHYSHLLYRTRMAL